MATNIIRPLPLYYSGKKVAEVSSGSYDVQPGDEAQIAIDGYAGHSDGATLTKIDATTILPVKGLSVTILADMLAKKYVTVGLFVDGKVHQIDMRITHASYDWDAKSGAAHGKFTFEGGQPDVTG